ncbi:MAG: DNA-deoxyinosine glycosylase, partial [Burkholderiales bacterium]|nr:DNA-deoxyinosine glycosylase [Burkholderiales bacterium]
MPPELTGLPPIAREDARILILGSFPGERSLAEGRYYAHPQNQFWLLLAAVWPEVRLPRQYSARIRWLQARRIALWDVYGACRRQGSLDSAIEAARLNDLLGLVARLPRLERVACNGGLAYRVARRVLGSTGIPIAILPSSSPANASWSFER